MTFLFGGLTGYTYTSLLRLKGLYICINFILMIYIQTKVPSSKRCLSRALSLSSTPKRLEIKNNNDISKTAGIWFVCL